MTNVLPLQTTNGGRNPHVYQGSLASGKTPATIADSMGRVSLNGAVSVLANKACALTIYIFNRKLAENNSGNGWVLGSSTTAGYTRTFAAAGIDYFQAPPGAHFFISTDTASTGLYHDGDEVGQIT